MSLILTVVLVTTQIAFFFPKHKNRFEEKIVEIGDVLIYRNIHIFHTQQHIGTRQFSDSGTYGHICY